MQFLQCAACPVCYLLAYICQILAKVLAVLMGLFLFSITHSLLTFKKVATSFVFNLSDLLITYPTI